jgi:hypothetical protein
MQLLLLVLAILAALAPAPARAADLPEHKVADPLAAPLTDQNLLESDRFWPFHVGIARPMRLRPEVELPAGSLGVLIRVEPGGRARIDFGRDGVHHLATSDTDILERANRIRLGEESKLAPNFPAMVGTGLLDPSTNRPGKTELPVAIGHPGYLVVFADPGAAGFAGLAAALEPLRGRRGVLSVFFPQGSHSSSDVLEKLVAVQWKPAFVLDFLSAGYTAALIDADTPRPALLLLTADGRVLFQGKFEPGVIPKLTEKLEAAFPEGAPSTAASAAR